MQIRIALLLISTGLMGCQGGSLKKKNCQSCETITYGPQAQPKSIVNQVCGEDQISAHIAANTISNSSLTVVTTCK